MEEPVLHEGDGYWLRAFGELSTCRSSGFGIGAIPWTAIVEYGDRAGLSDNMIDVLVIVIRQMDEAFTTWHDAEQKRRAQASKTGR